MSLKIERISWFQAPTRAESKRPDVQSPSVQSSRIQPSKVQSSRVQASRVQPSNCPESKCPAVQSPNNQTMRPESSFSGTRNLLAKNKKFIIFILEILKISDTGTLDFIYYSLP